MSRPVQKFFKDVISDIYDQFMANSQPVHTGTWQGFDISKKPEAAMQELLNVSFSVHVGGRDVETLGHATRANLPWAEDHFQERVAGQPFNPGIQWKHWPYAHKAAESLDQEGQFNHTYTERYWPKQAPGLKPTTDAAHFADLALSGNVATGPNFGIRHQFGDLNDVVDLLGRDPLSRQAYLPVFFPEDTGAVHGGRVPCTLGYHFIVRNDELHMVYYLRSCDLVRHFRDDIYLSVRLQMWMVEQLRERFGERWLTVKPGSFTMHITSLHCFVNDFRKL